MKNLTFELCLNIPTLSEYEVLELMELFPSNGVTGLGAIS